MKSTVAQHFDGREAVVGEIYDLLLGVAREWGPVEEDPKKTSIHLNRRYAFAGIRTGKDHIVLTIKATKAINSPRVRKSEQASAHRWYCYVKITSPDEVDAQLIEWLRTSYELS